MSAGTNGALASAGAPALNDPDAAKALTAELQALAKRLAPGSRRPMRVMEVCGTHTMAIARHGLLRLLPEGMELISGPGCPVCVTEAGYVDAAVALAQRGVTIATFGDMVRVPGSALGDKAREAAGETNSLEVARARGARVEVCYSPARALELAESEPEREVVFLAVGFETTVAPTVAMLAQAALRGLTNLSLLTAFKVVPPALEALLCGGEILIDGLLCPAHVSAIIGAQAYEPVARGHGVPCVVAGFEALDILYGLVGLLRQHVEGRAEVENQYNRVVKQAGNTKAQALMATYLTPTDAFWRGLGCIPQSGLSLRPEWARFDAAKRYGIDIGHGREPPGCVCGQVLCGKLRPHQCGLFGNVCTPATPVGPCMVSSEGSCAAAFKYGRRA
jgi:hydrogenase expression/formation protein HypD